MTVYIPYFNGNLKIEDFLDWIAKIERYFKYAKTLTEMRVKLVVCRLKRMALTWWERVQSRPQWTKHLLKLEFLPPDYEQILFQKYQRCQQGYKIVHEHIVEFMRLQVTRYLEGLQVNLKDRIGVQVIRSLSEVMNLALNAELMQQESDKEAKKVDNPCARPYIGKYFWCNQQGHKSNECPTRKTVNILEREEEEEEMNCESDGFDEGEEYELDEGHIYVVWRMMVPKGVEETQHHQLFRTYCIIGNRVFGVIVDSENCENIIERETVKKLKLPLEKYREPYLLDWIKFDTEKINVTECRKVPSL
ncbi:hypothetical protein MANES_16G085001v8 [Manihot esculenta]|uniref:Uncharacterized protein n=1 Tax=Manihot esculenta TaxID=3983 RepID=A0ACB7G7C3_MANES|nr:hypothetical protein MANES_16G085001v8 [Manihot esculenta]